MFEYEVELVDRFIMLKNISQNSITECPFRWGSIDVVEYQLDRIKFLNSTQINFLKDKDNLSIFSFLYRKKGHTLDYLAESTRISKNIVKNRMKKMIELSICDLSNNLYFINNNIQFPDIVVRGYEMKLNDIKKAINQAVVNKKYCDYSYIVMPKNKYSLCLEYKGLIKKCGLGLIVVDEKKVYEIIRPRRVDHNKNYKLKSKIFILDYLSSLNQLSVE
ncbi:MAG: hypothetical protein RR623_07825 [Bacilli bacterium]|uniref:hypothetical protein n=1 Tax=Anaerorhabdus sp. TaxID=1872524 RepID=UPI002FC9F3D6